MLSQAGLGNPTATEISMGLKQALEFGTSASSDKLSATDGFFANAGELDMDPWHNGYSGY